jgi:hypothetical protein
LPFSCQATITGGAEEGYSKTSCLTVSMRCS